MAATNYESLKKRTRNISQAEIIEMFGGGPYKLNLGSGVNLQPDCINIDMIDPLHVKEGKYLQLDLEVARLPFPKGSVEEVIAAHVMEHLHNFPALMNELHRVMKPNGSLRIYTPCYPSPEAFQDPTHVRFFTTKTFEYFTKGQFLYEHVGKTYGLEGWQRRYQSVQNGWELHVKMDR